MKKRFCTIVITVCALLTVMTATAYALDGNNETLTIKGDGVSRELTFNRAELQALKSGITQNIYSATNNFPTDKVMYRKGVSLNYLLQQAGIKDTARQLKFTASDGYSRTFTYEELLKDDRYYFAPDGSRAKVPTIIAFADSSKGFDSMDNIEMVLTMGQRVKGEQNNPWFVKYLQTIEVNTAEPERWPQVTFRNQASGPDDVKVELKHNNFDMVKIYYTTDGTNPNINSKLYNVSASYYQPHLNQPIVIKGNTEIRAIAIGAGKIDSAVASTSVTFDENVFNDLENYPWARVAIEDLSSKDIIKGMGNSRFAPEGPLTRAQFATMMVLALGEKPQSVARVSFSDVKSTDWYYSYVAKAAEIGIIKGYPDGTFRPNQVLSRQEMLTITVQAMGVKLDSENVAEELLAPFASEGRISDWARGYVAYAEHLGILEHGHMVKETDSGLSFDAQRPTARAEAAVTVYLMLKQK